MPDLSRRIRVGGTSYVHWQDIGADRLPAESTASGRVKPWMGLSFCHSMVSMRWRCRSRKAP